MDFSKNYYDILDVPYAAKVSDIKKSYRRMALIYHPDRVDIPYKKQAEEKFKEIVEAHYILSDVKKRRVYDQYLMTQADFKNRFKSQFYRKFDQKEKYTPEDVEEILKRFFGDAVFRNFQRKQSRTFSDSGFYYKKAVLKTRGFGLGPEGKVLALIFCATYYCFRYFNEHVMMSVVLEVMVPLGLLFIMLESKLDMIDEPVYESTAVWIIWITFGVAMVIVAAQIA